MTNLEYINSAFTADELKSGRFISKNGHAFLLETGLFVIKIANYVDFNNIKTILEIGSRDAYQSVEFSKWFPNAQIYTFEPVPVNMELCEYAIRGIENITLVPMAVGKTTGKSKFYQVINGNIGMSSFYKFTEENALYHWQKEIEVDCIRMDEWLKQNNIGKVDLLWIDVEGAEIDVFESFGDDLKNIEAIHTEVCLEEIWKGGAQKNDVHTLLSDNFNLFYESDLQGQRGQRVFKQQNCIYLNKKYVEKLDKNITFNYQYIF